jgi:tetratricopeptide (TPR) repeat protein
MIKYIMKPLAFFLILLLPFLGSAQVEDSLQLKPYFAEAERRIAAYDFDGALKQLSTCYIKRPGHIPYLLRIGYCHTQLGRYPDAKLFYGEALKLDSLHTTALSALGSIYERERNYRKAQSYFAQLTQIDSTNSYYYKKSANIALHQGDALHALQQFIQAHSYNPTDLEVITRLSTIYLAMGELGYAKEMVEKGLRLDQAYTEQRIGQLKEIIHFQQ